MKLKSKLNMFIVGILTTFTVTIIILISINSYRSTNKEIEIFKEKDLERAKQTLINYTNIAYEVIRTNYSNAEDMEFLKVKYGESLKNIIELAEAIIDSKKNLVVSGKLTLFQAKKEAAEAIKNLRYDNGVGYVWINSTELPYPKMIMHPTVPALDGIVLDNPKYNVALGINQNLFQAAVEVSAEKGEGFVDYLWPKAVDGGLTEDKPKLSYVKRIENWNWILGTGIYVDDAMEDAKKESLKTIEAMRYDGGTGYFAILNTDKPYPKVLMHPISPSLEGIILDDPKFNVVEGKNLFRALAESAESGNSGFVSYPWPKPLKDGLTEALPKLAYSRLFPEWGWIITTGFYIDSINTRVEFKKEEALNQTKNLIFQILLTTVALSLLLLIISFIFIGRILKPVLSTSSLFKEMAKGSGDLTVRLNARFNDEIGEMSGRFNEFADKLLGIITTIKRSANNTGKLKTSLEQATKHTAGELNKITNQVNKINEKIGSLDDRINLTETGASDIEKRTNILSEQVVDETSAVEESTAAINEMVASINSVSNITKTKKEATYQLVVSAKNGSQLLENMSTAVNDINIQIGSIQEMVTLIDNISSQTNLLAMNAAIEAAHAGEAGKGFSVVADEIRKLSANTNQSSRLIASSLGGIVDSIERATKASEETSTTFMTFISEVTKIAEALDEIESSTVELATGGGEITKAMMLLSDLSGEVKEGAVLMESKSKEMQNEMLTAKEESARVRESMKGIFSTVQEISNEMEKIVGITGNLAETADELSNEVNRFKTD